MGSANEVAYKAGVRGRRQPLPLLQRDWDSQSRGGREGRTVVLGTPMFGEHLGYRTQGAEGSFGPSPPKLLRENCWLTHTKHYVEWGQVLDL